MFPFRLRMIYDDHYQYKNLELLVISKQNKTNKKIIPKPTNNNQQIVPIEREGKQTNHNL